MNVYLAARPEVRRLSRYRFALDGREVDFGPAVDPRRSSAIPSPDHPAPERSPS